MLPYYYRSREREVDNGKHKEDASDYLVLSHLRGIWIWRRLDGGDSER